jgi:thymidine phosphorylase
VRLELGAPAAGHVEAIDALEVGLACVELGVGRLRKQDRIDPAAGIVIQAPVGAQVAKGAPLAVVHARSRALAEQVAPRLTAAWKLSASPVRRPPHVVARVDAQGVRRETK